MTQEQKELLLRDLCTRLPYKVKVDIPDLFISTKTNVEVLNEIFCGNDGEFRCNDSGMLIKHVRPYLFPLSSMTAEQKTSHNFLKHSAHANPIKLIDWYIKNHFDYRGLIPMGLANDATDKNIY